MSQRLPELIEPNRLAETGQFLKGTLALGKMKRLSPLLLQPETDNSVQAGMGNASIELEFGADESGQLYVTGSVEADLTLQCQRCMQAMDLHIAEKISLAIVHSSAQANQLPSYYEPLLVEEEMVSLPELIEDEILLALPSVPMHEIDSCPVKLSASTGSTRQSGSNMDLQKDQERKNPFDILKQLKTKK